MQVLKFVIITNPNTMKFIHKKLILIVVASLLVFSCKKQEVGNAEGVSNLSMDKMVTADSASVSSAASTQVLGKEFVKTASVDMEVKDVYDATLKIENSLKEIGGYVTSSQLVNNTLSEEIYNQSDEKAMMVKKSQMKNDMIVKVPVVQLASFLQNIHSNSLYLNSRIINAEDVTSNIKLAKLEQHRMQKKTENIAKIKQDSKTVEQNDNNEREKNQTTIDSYDLQDNISYSTVSLSLKEPNIRVVEIEVTNSKAIDAKYKTNFFYESKISIINGFYLIQEFIILLLNLWTFWIIAGVIFYLLKRRKINLKKKISEKIPNP